jgi:hypothetical protein
MGASCRFQSLSGTYGRWTVIAFAGIDFLRQSLPGRPRKRREAI